MENYTKELNILYGDEEDYSYITKKDYKIILKQHKDSLERIYNFLEKNDYMLVDLESLGDIINLLENKINEEEKIMDKYYEVFEDVVRNYLEDNGYSMVSETIIKNIAKHLVLNADGVWEHVDDTIEAALERFNVVKEEDEDYE